MFGTSVPNITTREEEGILPYLAVSPDDSQVSKIQLTAEDGCENKAGVIWAGSVLTSSVLTSSVLLGTSRKVRPVADFYLLSFFVTAAPSNIQQLLGSGDLELPRLLGFHHSTLR